MWSSKRFLRLLTAFGLGAAVISMSGLSALAQSLTNTGDVQNTGTGTIRFGNTNSQFTNDGGTVTNDGTIEFEEDAATTYFNGTAPLGETDVSRIGGTVLYSNGAGSQTTQGRYYTNLALSGASTKSISDNTFVFAAYTIDGSTGNRTYTGTFYYDGDNSSNQLIAPENGAAAGTNRYNALTFQNDGIKTINGEVITDDAFTMDATGNAGLALINGILRVGTTTTQDAAAPRILVNNGGELRLGSGVGDLAYDVDVVGTLSTFGSGAATFGGILTASSGTVNLDNGDAEVTGTLTLTNDVASIIDVDASRTLTINGTFTNNHAPAVNLDFDDESTIAYTGGAAQAIVSNTEANPYGSMTVSGAGSKVISGDVFLSEDLSVSDDNLDATGLGSELTMLDAADGTVTYGAGIETEGTFSRRFEGNAAGALTFNNEFTTIDVTDDQANVTTMTLSILPGTTPGDGGQFETTYDAQLDVNREIKFSYDAGGSVDWVATMNFGYLTTEEPLNATARENVRFLEETNSATPFAFYEKVATGELITRNFISTPFREVGLVGFRPDGATVNPPTSLISAQIDNGEDLILSGRSVPIIAVNEGRWSNPNTWDEGREPIATDDVLIDGFVVHAGFRRINVDGGSGDGQITEGSPLDMAASVTIEQNGSASSALIIGGDAGSGNADEQNVNWRLATGAELINNSTGAAQVPDIAAFLAAVAAAPAGTAYDGFINVEGNTYHTNTLTNTGQISNGGTVEVGD